MTALGSLERAVMERLWAWDRPASVREVLDDLLQDRPLAYTTVMTVLDNLHRKGVVMREKHGRAYSYRAARSLETWTADQLDDVLAGVGNRGGVLLKFVERMSPAEREHLRTLMNELDAPNS